MCPICSIGIVVSLGLSRWLKVDDSISGLWIGALLLALSIWTLNWLFRKRDKKPVILLPVFIVAYWLLAFLPLYATKVISNTNCLTILGLNRLVFGSLLGIVLTGLTLFLDKLVREPRRGKALFPYQKVIIPLGALLIASLILNAYCK
jgi:uncharacterized membrane protein (DUF485 family)